MGKLDEQGELNRAGVLKFIHKKKIKFVTQYVSDTFVVQQFQKQMLLISKIEHTKLSFTISVDGQCIGTQSEHLRQIVADVLMQSWMFSKSAGHIIDRLS